MCKPKKIEKNDQGKNIRKLDIVSAREVWCAEQAFTFSARFSSPTPLAGMGWGRYRNNKKARRRQIIINNMTYIYT